MVSKATKMALGGHTAGIFADMSVDGPPIGTLVTIIDRAKNLPNRKSMGKQNPYCACRLGKEAKKTNTDMRGGQTPKWDQELRFTVHESPDYYQLKVSIFNDDKKTDLIGETWIDLKNVVIQGGGQNDLWHSLQYKGKYAGDIRIELTYYDTRPKDEAVIGRRTGVEKAEAKAETSHSAVSGPRQAKPKRRPLPADPTGSSPARPPSSDRVAPPKTRDNYPSPARPPMPELPQSTPPSHPQRAYETPDDLHRQWGPPQTNVVQKNSTPTRQPPQPHESYQNTPPREPIQELPGDYDRRATMPPMPPSRDGSYPPPPQDYGQLNHVDQNAYDYPLDPTHPRDAYQTPPRQNVYQMPAPEHYSGPSPSYQPPSRGSPYGAADPHSHSHSPDPPPQPPMNPVSGDHHSHYHRYSTSHTNNDVFRDSPLRNSVNHSDFHPRHEYMQAHVQDEEEEGPPPPPPAHRQVFSQPPLPPPVEHPQNDMQPIPMPEPLNVEPRRTSPLPNGGQQTYVAYSPNYSSQSFQPTDREPVYSTSPTPSYNHAYHNRGYSQDRPSTSNGELVPSALVPGYEATVTDEPEQEMYDSHLRRQPSNIPSQPTPPAQVMRTSPGITSERPSSRSPDLRQIPARKSVSPHPPPKDSAALPSTPFSPDCYDALNPNASTSAAVQQPNSPYDTPEAAMEAARQREVEKLRDLGPIIGNDGRVIDPSDHLPTDTWAPEPERKSRKPEIVVRFKHAPQNSSRFSSRESSSTNQRPHSVVAPSYSSQAPPPQPINAVTTSSQNSGRNRLQKQPTRPQSYIQPSPSRPPKEHTPSPRISNALRERDPYGYNGNPTTSTPPYHSSTSNTAPAYNSRTSPSPTSHHSPSNHMVRHYHSTSTGPPIPAKIPVHPGTQNYPGGYGGSGAGSGHGGGEFDALSEEMKRIDIGVGPGSAGKGGRRGRVSFAGSPGYGG
ncbi:hypothetical protein FQN51_008472 [Onygenales sp. PD_10]|nr:hypothetical protein FQN51_008472 [Onygenales sp. PD_10]